MLTRTQFLIIFLLAIVGTIFAWYLQSFINWTGVLEWLKERQAYEFICVASLVIACVSVAWANNKVTNHYREKQERDLAQEEFKERVAEKVRNRQKVKV